MPSLSAPPVPRPAVATRPGAASGRGVLRAAVATWFGVAMLGQLAFAAYVVGLYGGAALSGQAAHWNRVTPRAWVPGEPVGNLVFASHVAFTVAILLGGLIQLLPPLRRRAPALHRWNGRLYLAAAVVLAARWAASRSRPARPSTGSRSWPARRWPGALPGPDEPPSTGAGRCGCSSASAASGSSASA
ncbi:DUF2306 domain-containing protein [Piscinibacter sakaiensis]|uniref:DUF2306 domain-containing protein n=1 Tax=Piscinibacter sakaiensis TaxID=1547922 RepID=UPI00372D3F41